MALQKRIETIRWRLRATLVLTGTAIGFAIGLGAFTFVYADGAAYLTNDPKACTNCHVMNEQFDGWIKSPHHGVATCNDCHAPHDLVGKYYTKATNGFWHSFAFTTGKFHEPIQIKPRNRAVTETACRRCHGEMVHVMDSGTRAPGKMACLHCHSSVGHLH